MYDIERLMITAISGATIGYFTNWIAIRMLFRPLEEKYIFGIKVPFTPGMVPRERYSLSKKVAETIEEHLLDDNAISEALSSDAMITAIETMLANTIDSLANDDTRLADKVDADILSNTIREYMFEIYSTYFDDFTDMSQSVHDFLKTSDKTFADYIGSDKKEVLKEHMVKYAPSMRNYIQNNIESNPNVEITIKRITTRLIEDNLKGFMGIFVKPEKIYAKMKDSAIQYVNDDANFDEIFECIWFVIEILLNKPLTEVADLADKEQLDTILKEMNDKYGVFDKIFDALVVKLINKILDIQISTVSKKFLLPRKDAIVGYGSNLIKKLVISNSHNIATAFDTKAIVQSKINDFEVSRAEEIILDVVKRELNMITMLGGVLGFLIGVATFFLSR